MCRDTSAGRRVEEEEGENIETLIQREPYRNCGKLINIRAGTRSVLVQPKLNPGRTNAATNRTSEREGRRSSK